MDFAHLDSSPRPLPQKKRGRPKKTTPAPLPERIIPSPQEVVAEAPTAAPSGAAVGGGGGGIALLDSLKMTMRVIANDMETLEFQIRNNAIAANAANMAATCMDLLMRQKKSATQDTISSAMLSVRELKMRSSLLKSIERSIMQLQLYQRELADPNLRNLSCLFLEKEPMSNVQKQSDKVREPYKFKFIRGARCDDTVSLGGGGVTAKHEGDGEHLVENERTAFPKGCVYFSKGTNMKGVRLVFTAENDSLVKSNLSKPFIVTTNESQYSEAISRLFKEELYAPGRFAIDWFSYANMVHLYYLNATRQPLKAVTRSLCKDDLDYFRRAYIFNGTLDESEAFWKWFGRVLHLLRFQKHISEAWMKGYMIGFRSKKFVEEVLRGKPAGTFVLRFSANTIGQLAISWVDEANECHHYLVPPTTKNISELIMSKQSLVRVLVAGTYVAKTKEETFAALVPKTMVMANKRKKDKEEGYEDLF